MDEKDILKWANRRVRGTGSLLQITSFKDLTLRNGVFILQLLRAVAEECVDAAEILPGSSFLNFTI